MKDNNISLYPLLGRVGNISQEFSINVGLEVDFFYDCTFNLTCYASKSLRDGIMAKFQGFL